MTHSPNRASLFAATLLSVSLALPGWAQDTAPETEADTGDTPPAMEATGSTVLATVNGEEITLGHVVAAKEQLPQQYQQLPNEVLLPGLIDQLVQQTVLSQAIDEVGQSVEIRLANERRTLVAAEKIDDVITEAVDEEAIQAAYDAQYSDAEPTLEWNASHILVETEEEAADILTQAQAEDADFAALAKEFSTGPSGPNGGELGWFSAGMMVEPFELAVQDMESGEVAGPIETQFGWHVIKLNDTREKGAPALDDVRDELVSQLQTSAVEEALAALMEEAEIEQTDVSTLDPAVLSDMSLLDE
ncbi:peptidylprolyl isomerase [Maritimibacter sp. UBA3975]|uniref:peptidylprolyl isomerase n=1 Tax=Maritimibacter sp. UBA3975 TaxID=1946833 RepID=UPI000C092CAE|nr:peptidylprolyl isomerase [Maritimibacter sp. UBA3975]MAM63470.1 peptidylprolyl isomerase [Maritimibacter sp.]|tara:strand:+ start:10312 stop:11220 length:909 start_codon:yes stop_codon:yes gene_type:complete